MPFPIIKQLSHNQKKLEVDLDLKYWSYALSKDGTEAEFSYAYIWRTKIDKFIGFLKQHKNIVRLNLSDAIIEKESIIKILGADLNISEYDFSGTKFDRACLPAVAANSKITQIGYKNSRITVEDEKELLQILKWKRLAKVLIDPARRSVSIMAKKEEWIKYTGQATAYLSHQGISDRHISALISFVNDNNVNHLDLSNNYITNKGALILINKLSSKLSILNLSFNPIYDENFKEVFEQQQSMQVIYTGVFFEKAVNNDNNLGSTGGENVSLKCRL